MKTLSFKITSDHFLLCLFLSLLWGITETTTSSTILTTTENPPRNAEGFQTVTQTETSITLGWKNVHATFNYTLVFNGTEINVIASADPEVKHTIPDLTSGTKYNFQLFTVFEYAKSTGVNLPAVTAPRNAEDFRSVEQTETSITLGWKNVDATFNYTLVINGEGINVNASDETEVKYTIPDLTNGTKYNFQLFTVFEYAKSTGVNLTAVTAPRNAEGFRSFTQNETSITLGWDKVDDILDYTLVFNGKEINVTASDDIEVKHTTSQLISGTKYNFQLFTVFEYAKSTGVNLTAVTAPRSAGGFRTVTQNETSITLRWDKVDDILNYTLVFNGKEINVTASDETEVKHTIPDLTSGTKYNFQLFTVFENAISTGVYLTAVTAPRSAGGFRTVTQNETSITLRWDKVDAILNYRIGLDGKEINVNGSDNTEVKHTILQLTSGTKYIFQLFTVFEYAKSTGVNHTAVTAPRNTEEFKSVTQTETSITLGWDKVDDILNYTLVFNGTEINVIASDETEVKHTISDLTSRTKYNFQLFTVFEYAKSTGVNLTAVTAPLNAEDFKSFEQNETSITLRWDKVDDILDYTLVFNGTETNVPASDDIEVKHTIPDLTNGTKYNFQLFTVFEYAKSTGVNLTAVTAPLNAEDFRSVEQTETSITLGWKNVDATFNYTLVINGEGINVNASDETEVKYTIPDLTNGTKYNFQLFTVFENAESTGVNLTAVTAPLNAEDFRSVEQTETSITLGWKNVDVTFNYTLVINGEGINVTASDETEVKYTIPDLTNGTKYNFQLFTVFEYAKSTGVNLTAVTAPLNAEDFRSVEQTETSITLGWKNVDVTFNYTLVINGEGINVTASDETEVKYTIPDLTNGTKYNFQLFTVFEYAESTGVNLTAVTAPRSAGGFKSFEQTETSITLRWDKVDDILHYILNGTEINVPASDDIEVNQTISNLTSGSKYNFQLFTVFEYAKSTGVNLTAVTAPRSAGGFKSFEQTETSITLRWDKVDDILHYILDGKEINVPASDETEVKHTIPDLTSGTKYNFQLFTVFEYAKSTGVNLPAVTAPRSAGGFRTVTQNETSITLRWDKVDAILNYRIGLDGKEINVNGSDETEVKHTILQLDSGTKYILQLFTVFEYAKSTGVNHTAVTAPRNAEELESVGQNETSITLQWRKVNAILNYTLVINESMINVSASEGLDKVKYAISNLTSGTKYNVSLLTVFENVKSTGVNYFADTVPSTVDSVNVTERSVTNITLMWQRMKNDWDYRLEMNGENRTILQSRTMDDVSHSIPNLEPGTEYPFRVITLFSGLSSIAYEGFTVTGIDCANGNWNVTTSSIQGRVRGLFSSAQASNTSTPINGSTGNSSVSFSGLYPGATYNVTLQYEKNDTTFEQCRHTVTIVPPYLRSSCEYSAAGYSMSIIWNKPEGIWTSVEVNVTGKTPKKLENGEQSLDISGFLPARKYEVSIASVSGDVRSDKALVFSCLTDPRGVIAGSFFAVLIFAVLVCLVFFIFLKRPDIISRKKQFIGASRQSKEKSKAIPVAKFPEHFYQLGVDENRGFSQEYESFIPVGTDQTRNAATLPENKPRNRFNNVLPYDWCRVKLATPNPNGNSDYINASYMPGYNSSKDYIACQGPLPTTVNDFWRMIWEQRVRGIVMVTNCTEGGRTKCERYWPADSKPVPHGELIVTLRSEQQEPDWTLREFRVKNRNNSEERTVKHFHFTAWPDHGVPQGTEVLIQFRGLVRRHIERDGAGAPTVVHCSAGVGRTGTIMALDVLLQQLEKERAVGINGFVHKMRLSRPHMVQTESQFVFLHHCIMDCLQPHENTEENIYENTEENIYENEDTIYANATALREFQQKNIN
ncbi:receptor-type tyrosine-protein phosphatase H isoform X3 [Trematomus bernacchii]|uniref:receptor-type tyrosine-protein phosphatase H isoform X3 n=1 Tax=Trematomus bernacchii TaxID=40690 RepID=UPI00146D1C12|nr:receptor-type tyrosine-protein phosphatase H isoform X3 [Trematomus bernacchii]